MANLTELLHHIDEQLFVIINHHGNKPQLNGFMLLLRNALTWIPLYAFVLFWAWKKFNKQFIPFLLLSLVAFAIADFSSASILKPLFARPRPCYNPDLSGNLNMLVGCGGLYSFPSSHATNHFALAAFWFWVIFICTSKKWHWLWIWAFAICYAQVYVGKHYPFDVLFGSIYGLAIGTVCAKIFEWWIDSNRKIGKQLRTNKNLPNNLKA
jgi:undecaprenyl-diphosphatase